MKRKTFRELYIQWRAYQCPTIGLREIKETWLAAFAGFHGVNTPAMASFSYLDNVTKCRVRGAYANTAPRAWGEHAVGSKLTLLQFRFSDSSMNKFRFQENKIGREAKTMPWNLQKFHTPNSMSLGFRTGLPKMCHVGTWIILSRRWSRPCRLTRNFYFSLKEFMGLAHNKS